MVRILGHLRISCIYLHVTKNFVRGYGEIAQKVILGRGDSMIFKISWAADPSRSGTVRFQSGMGPSCHINYQKFGEFMFAKIIAIKLIFASNFSSVLFRHTRSRQTFDT